MPWPFFYRINRISVNHYFIKQHTYATCRTIRTIMCFFKKKAVKSLKKRPSLKKGRQDQQRGLLLVSAQREDVDWKADKPSKVLPSTSRTMWGSNYVLLPAGRQRGAKAQATMEFQAREHIMKTRKSAASSEKKLWSSNYVLPPALWSDHLCSVKLEPHMVLEVVERTLLACRHFSWHLLSVLIQAKTTLLFLMAFFKWQPLLILLYHLQREDVN